MSSTEFIVSRQTITDIVQPFVESNFDNRKDYYSFTDFGADPTGIIDSYTAIKKCFDDAYTNGRNVVQNTGTFLLGSSTSDILIKVNTDLSGSILDYNGMTHAFQIRRDETTTTYDSSSIQVTGINGSTDTVKGQSYFDTMSSTLDHHFIRMTINGDYYIYRGDAQTRVDLNYVINEGYMMSPLTYPLDVNHQVTQIEALKREQTILTVRGITIKETSLPTTVFDMMVEIKDCSRVHIIDVSFFNERGALIETNVARVGVSGSYECVINGLHTDEVQKKPDESSFPYTIALGDSYDIIIKNATGQGDGWGAVGNNNCRRVEFVNCNLNRIDFHRPIVEYLKVTNCIVGTQGVLVTIIGDLIITDCNFIIFQNSVGGLQAFIGSRSDTGGFCDGNLIVTNCTLGGLPNATSFRLIQCGDNGTDGPTGNSPIDFTFFKNIYIDGLMVEDNIFVDYILYASNSLKRLKYPSQININNMVIRNAASTNIRPGLRLFLPAVALSTNKYGQFTSSINFTNCVLPSLGSDTDATSLTAYGTHNVYVTFDNVIGTELGKGTTYFIMWGGQFMWNNSILQVIDVFNSGNNTACVFFGMATNSTFITVDSDQAEILNTATTGDYRFYISNSVLKYYITSQKTDFASRITAGSNMIYFQLNVGFD